MSVALFSEIFVYIFLFGNMHACNLGISSENLKLQAQWYITPVWSWSPRVRKPNALLLSEVNVHKYNNITMLTHLKCILSGAVACYRRESLSHVAAASKRDACPRCTYVEFISLYIRRIHIMLPSVFSKMPSSYIR